MIPPYYSQNLENGRECLRIPTDAGRSPCNHCDSLANCRDTINTVLLVLACCTFEEHLIMMFIPCVFNSVVNTIICVEPYSNASQYDLFVFQNPRDCSSARKLICGVCSHLSNCGLGCLIHQIGLCLVTAYLSNRTMILDCSVWRYSSKGWGAAFLPITNCTIEHIQEKSIPGT